MVASVRKNGLPDGVCNPVRDVFRITADECFVCRTGFATPSGMFSGSPLMNVSDGVAKNISDGVANPVRQRSAKMKFLCFGGGKDFVALIFAFRSRCAGLSVRIKLTVCYPDKPFVKRFDTAITMGSSHMLRIFRLVNFSARTIPMRINAPEK